MNCAKSDARVALAIRIEVLEYYMFEEETDLVDSPYVKYLDV